MELKNKVAECWICHQKFYGIEATIFETGYSNHQHLVRRK